MNEYSESRREVGLPTISGNFSWYPLQTRYQCEKRVDAALREQGLETFAPTRREVRKWSDRTKIVESPLFPGYGFVRLDAELRSLSSVLRTPGLVRFVTRGREFAVVPDEEIDSIRTVVKSDTHYEPGPYPAVGQHVRIRGGCLEGVEGVLTANTGRGELIVSVGAIGRSVKFVLGSYHIETRPS